MTAPTGRAHGAASGERPPVVIVGSGLAGLTAAVALYESGVPVHVFEASDGVGGRMRTDRHAEGFLIDRGFHLLFDACPVMQRWIDSRGLRSKAFEPGALMWTGRRRVPLANPVRRPAGIVRDLTTSLFPASDKLRLVQLAWEALTAPWKSASDAALALGQDVSASEYFWARGFSEAFIDRLARPLWGGLLLDRHLAGSAGPLLFTLKMLLHGSAVLPAGGVGAVPAQLLARLPGDVVTLNARVTSVVIEDGRATGVRVGRRKVAASAVVIATDPVNTAKLTGMKSLSAAEVGAACTTVFLAGTHRPCTGRKLVLDATRQLVVNHVAPLSEVQPGYAPVDQHLVAAVVVGESAELTDWEDISKRARVDAATMLGDAPGVWRILQTIHEPFAKFAQPPGVFRQLPNNLTPIRGVVLASEATADSSHSGAISSGEAAASVVRRELAMHNLAGRE